ncbi:MULTISPECIES: TRAP transporter small permease subunit [unclassified Roseibium]|uniref:TRAP transporter small permease n=1 Tax=unclassified Roseibium TaxID=2629323 RepID=UPI00317118A9
MASQEAGHGWGSTLEKYAQWLLTALICCVALGQFVQVITRYVLQVPVMGLEETILFPTLWLYILGAVNASRENTHIRANVLEIFLKTERQHTILAIIGEIISLAVGLWLLYWAWDYTSYAWRVWRESPTLYIPTFYADVALVTGLFLMMVYTALYLLGHIRTLMNGGAR